MDLDLDLVTLSHDILPKLLSPDILELVDMCPDTLELVDGILDVMSLVVTGVVSMLSSS